MLTFDVIGQRLLMDAPLVVEGTLDYIEAEFLFHDTEDWSDKDKWAHFRKAGDNFIIQLVGDRIEKSAHLNLGNGRWKVFVHGSSPDGERITTNEVELLVARTGIMDGDVLPEIPLSVAEQISLNANEAKEIARSVRDDAKAGVFDGEKGDTGKNAYEYAVAGGFTGSEDEFSGLMAAVRTERWVFYLENGEVVNKAVYAG